MRGLCACKSQGNSGPPLVANGMIKQLEDHGEDPDRELFEKALAFKDAMQHGYVGGGFETASEFFLSEALDEAKEVLEEHGQEKAERFMRVVKGEATFIRDVYPPWLDETRPKPKQRDAHSKVMRDFIEWAGQGITVEETDRKKAGAYISNLMSARALAPKTVERYRSSLSTLWTWLEEKGMTDLNNPWAKHRSIRPTVQTKRRPLSDEQLASLLSGCYDTPTYRQVLADLLRLGMVTGCRLEELCVLKKADVLKRKDGYWLVIRAGKTDAAAREVPDSYIVGGGVRATTCFKKSPLALTVVAHITSARLTDATASSWASRSAVRISTPCVIPSRT